MNKKKKLSSIPSGLLSRGLSISKMTLKSGGLAAGHGLAKLLNSNVDADKYITKQMKVLTKDLGELKGSLMKAGQLLSTYGEHFLPPDALEFIKSLQHQSPPVVWAQMEKVLRNNLPAEKIELLEINEEPLAAASLGQVHRAKIKATGEEIVLKIQYPDLEGVISSDLKALRRVLGILNFLPKDGNYETIFEEIRSMLVQELNYEIEAKNLKRMGETIKGDSRFVLPRVYDEFSAMQVLAMSYEDGLEVDSEDVQSISQERRNSLGKNYLDLYFNELFVYGFMQTDPHLGNYRVRLDVNGVDQFVLFDYGAVREVPMEFLKKYHKMIMGAYHRDKKTLLEGAMLLGLVREEDAIDLKDKFVEMCFLFTEPFWDVVSSAIPGHVVKPVEHLFTSEGAYRWHESDLPLRVSAMGKEIIFMFRLRTPPHELVFLDRKLGGTFSFLSVLGAVINGREVLEPRLRDPKLV